MVCGRSSVQLQGEEVGCEVHDGFQILSLDVETEFGFEISSKGEWDGERMVTDIEERCERE